MNVLFLFVVSFLTEVYTAKMYALFCFTIHAIRKFVETLRKTDAVQSSVLTGSISNLNRDSKIK